MAARELLEIDILPSFTSGAKGVIVNAFTEAVNASFTKVEVSYLKGAFSKGIRAAFSDNANYAQLENVFRRVVRRASSGLGEMAVGGAGKVAGGVAAAAGGAAMAMVNPMAGIGAIEKIVSLVADFVQAANPAVMEQFQMVVKDIMGTIGQTLVPVFQILTPLMQTYGDYIASILPSQEEMGALIEALKPVMDAFRVVLSNMAPIVKSLVSGGLSILVDILYVLANTVQIVVQAIAEGVVLLMKMIPDTGTRLTDWAVEMQKAAEQIAAMEPRRFHRTSTGGAATGVSQVGVLDYSTKLQVAAFGSAMSKEERQQQQHKERVEWAKKTWELLWERLTRPDGPAFPGREA